MEKKNNKNFIKKNQITRNRLQLFLIQFEAYDEQEVVVEMNSNR